MSDRCDTPCLEAAEWQCCTGPDPTLSNSLKYMLAETLADRLTVKLADQVAGRLADRLTETLADMLKTLTYSMQRQVKM